MCLRSLSVDRGRGGGHLGSAAGLVGAGRVLLAAAEALTDLGDRERRPTSLLVSSPIFLDCLTLL